MNKSKSIGTRFETQCVRYLRRRLDDERIERRALHGNKDMGDIFGLRAHGYTGICECKSYKTYSRADLARWQGESEVERGNSDADFILLIVHEANCGLKRFGLNSCYVQIRDLEKVIGGTVLAGDSALDMWVRLTLDDVCRLIMREGDIK